MLTARASTETCARDQALLCPSWCVWAGQLRISHTVTALAVNKHFAMMHIVQEIRFLDIAQHSYYLGKSRGRMILR